MGQNRPFWGIIQADVYKSSLFRGFSAWQTRFEEDATVSSTQLRSYHETAPPV